MRPSLARVHVGLVVYVLVFLVIPLYSIAWYMVIRGGGPFAGFQLVKGYLLITLSLLLYVQRINLLPHLCATLVVLAVAVIVIFLVLLLVPDLYGALYLVGNSTGIFLLDNRSYGEGVTFLQVYFVTSPMLAIAIAYYFRSAQVADTAGRRVLYVALSAVCVAGMFLAGTRNNMAVAVLLPVALFVLYGRKVIEKSLFCVAGLVMISILFREQLAAMLSPSEYANNLKLMLLQDYERLLSNPLSLFFGHGLGAYDFWEARAEHFYISELTYFELVRNFGLFGALIMSALLIFPIVYAVLIRPDFPEKHVVIGYGLYLIMCASNPNLFSSMGILILAMMVANIFLFDRRPRVVRRTTA